ncbi:FAD-dependent oxidoreductase [Trueperella pecoris]|uniref:FAD-dependent oxidoreductase n=1 Tax=Trueperella pecoris TaxID=2733571 RepID=A0A7M1QZ68_9ACTO|nr:FAD-dependent oxidoreductase [Trueperella pecoris]QOR47382.1 FAD-dependent oxidoreductase [Trueperella pecoris]
MPTSPATTSHVDVLIIGFGKAGKTLAGLMASAGKRVALVEQDAAMFGGTCINIGCVPTKTLLHDAEVGTPYPAAIERKNGLRAKMNAANLAMVEKPGAMVIVAHAEFVGERRVRLSAGEECFDMTADQVIIGTGSTPTIPAITGVKPDPRILTSTDLIVTPSLPPRLAILGAGYIALELANMYAHFGSEVTVYNRRSTILAAEDEKTRDAVATVLADSGVTFLHDTEIERVDLPHDQAAALTIHAGGSARVADALLIATGRSPNIDGLGLDAAGVEVADGAIRVDDFLRTSAEGVWAVGDVNGGPQHTYISFDDHRIVVDQILRGKGESGRSLANRGPIPSTTFITPPLSRVGLTAAEARARADEEGWDVAVATKDVADIAAMPRPKAVGDPRGFMQFVVDKTSGQILGATLFHVDSQEVINLVSMAMKHKIPYTELRDAIYTHPSSSEGINEVLKMADA